MADQLNLYNEALTVYLGERKLASLTEERGPRRHLDDVWDRNFVDTVLEQGYWNFAMRTAKIEFTPSVEPPFGYTRAFDHPSDMVRVASVCQDEFFKRPLLNMQDDAAYWFCDFDEIYVRWVSNDDTHGNDLANWPQSFTRWAAGYLALQSVAQITQGKIDAEKLDRKVNKLLIRARSVDAIKDPTKFTPEGRWASSRSGQYRNWDSVHAPH